MKKVLVCGAGGFIGSHLVKHLKKEKCWVRGIDLKFPDFSETVADDFIIDDLRDPLAVRAALDGPFDEVYQMAADMGGAGYVFTGYHDSVIMHHNALINLNVLDACYKRRVKKVFYASSACVYPKFNQEDTLNPKTSEASAYPAFPDSEYGWEKLFSERLYLAYHRNFQIQVRIARFHNIFGPEGAWKGGREKSPAAFCRKIAQAGKGDTIEMWGDGKQTRSYLYIDECLKGIEKLMQSDFSGPINIGSDEMVSINDLAHMIMKIAAKEVSIKHIPGPLGVRGRTSDNKLIEEKLGWTPDYPLQKGLEKTYAWILKQVQQHGSKEKR